MIEQIVCSWLPFRCLVLPFRSDKPANKPLTLASKIQKIILCLISWRTQISRVQSNSALERICSSIFSPFSTPFHFEEKKFIKISCCLAHSFLLLALRVNTSNKFEGCKIIFYVRFVLLVSLVFSSCPALMCRKLNFITSDCLSLVIIFNKKFINLLPIKPPGSILILSA